MKAKLLLRIAAVLMLLHTVGHTMAALTWNDAPNVAIGRVITAMQTNRFDFAGRLVSIGSFYEGYGYTMIGVLLLISIMLWLLAADAANPLTKKLLPCLGIFLLAMGIVEFIYFFPLAAAFSLLAGLCTILTVFGKSSAG